MMSLDKNMDFQTDGQFDMTNLSTEKIMNKITKIAKKKKKKKIKLIKPKQEEEQMTPTNFKYPNRCSKFWNVEKQKHEWKQYLGSGHYCSPEMIEEEEEICCKCETDCDVWKCMECDKYFCIECDPNEMATYTYNGAGIHCEPCAIANGFALGALG